MNGAQNREFAVRGPRIHATESGAGAAVVLVHGMGGSQTWQKIVGPLSRQFRVVVPDLPGFGNSACPERAWSTEDYVEFLRDFLGEYGLDRCALVGTSYGAEI